MLFLFAHIAILLEISEAERIPTIFNTALFAHICGSGACVCEV